jgi:hypothetical protein
LSLPFSFSLGEEAADDVLGACEICQGKVAWRQCVAQKVDDHGVD